MSTQSCGHTEDTREGGWPPFSVMSAEQTLTCPCVCWRPSHSRRLRSARAMLSVAHVTRGPGEGGVGELSRRAQLSTRSHVLFSLI